MGLTAKYSQKKEDKKFYAWHALLLMFLFHFNTSNAIEKDTLDPAKIKAKIEIGPEFIWPSSYYQSIHTTSINSIFWIRYFKKAQLNINFGVTATYAWGTSLDFYNTDTALFYYETSAFGAGPILQLNQTVFHMGRFSIEGTAIGGLIIYDKKG